MSAAKHTPVNWVVQSDGFCVSVGEVRKDGTSLAFADLFVGQFVGDYERALHKARLIAAAPCLLEALQALVALQDSVDPEGLFRGLEGVKARAAIAKAVQS